MYALMYARTHVRVCMYVRAYVRVCVRAHTRMYVSVCVHTHIRVCVCVPQRGSDGSHPSSCNKTLCPPQSLSWGSARSKRHVRSY